jgi:hypothetical protein
MASHRRGAGSEVGIALALNNVPTREQVLLREGVEALAAALTAPDDGRRQTAVRHVQEHCLPALQGLLVDRLVEMVGHGEAAGGRAVASLRQFCPPATEALVRALSGSRSEAVQLRLLGGLAALAQGLGTPDLCNLMTDLLIVRHRAAGPVRLAVGQLLADLRAVTEVRQGAARGDQASAPALRTAPGPRPPEGTGAERDEATPTA